MATGDPKGQGTWWPERSAMTVLDTYALHDKGNRVLAVSASGHAMRPGLGSWLALLFIGIWAIAWVQNEQVVAWLLSQDIIGEGLTRTLPGALRWTSVAMAILGLMATWRLVRWSVLGTYHWKPVQTLTTLVGQFLNPMVSPLRSLLSAVALALGRVLGLLLRPLRLSVAIVARTVSMLLRYNWQGILAILYYARRVVSTIAQAVGRALYYFWWGTSTILLKLWVAVTTPLKYLLLATAILLYTMWLGGTAVTRTVGVVLTYVWSSVSAAIQVLNLVLRRGVSGPVQVLTLILRRAGLGISIAQDYLSHYVSIAAQALALVLVHLTLRFTLVLNYVWRSAYAIAQATNWALHRLWLGVSMTAQAVGLVLRRIWLGISIALDYMSHYVSIVAGAVAMVLRIMWHDVSAVTQVVGLVLRYLWGGVSALLRHLLMAVFTILMYLPKGAAILLRHVWAGISTVLGTSGTESGQPLSPSAGH